MLANDWRNYEMMGDYLAHHGILGMKWGIRRFQNPDGTRTAAGKARYNEGGEKSEKNPIQKISDSIKKSKTDKQRKAALEKAREAKRKKAEEAKAAEQHEADKKKALESGDYKQIQKYSNELTTQELKSALDRADKLKELNRKVIENTPKEKDVWSTIDDVANKIGTATNAFNKSKDAWNAFAKVANTFLDEDSMLPELGTNIAEQKEKKRKEKEESERKAKIEEVTKSLDPDKIMKNQQLFSDKELSSAVARLTAYNNIKKEKKAQEDERAAEKQKKLDAKAEKKAEKEAKKLKRALEEASSKPLDSDDGLEYINMLENDNSRMNFSDPKYDHITDDWDFF
jgi:hypothetical protein